MVAHFGSQCPTFGSDGLTKTWGLLWQANLAVQEGRLNVANTELAKAQAVLDEKQRELDEVQAKFDAAMKEKQVRKPACSINYSVPWV